MRNGKTYNHKITTKFEDIGPELAKKYLARNVSNRNLREATVRAYEIDMRAGNWVSTHQGIAFNDRGDLIDGQHRLAAIVRSRATVRLLVTRGLPTESGNTKTMDAVDMGVLRNVSDQLKLQHGYRNANRASGAARAISQLICGGEKLKKHSISQILGVLQIYGRNIAEIGTILDASKEKPLRRAQFVAALAFARAVEPSIADRFCAGVISGANLAADSPILAFRNFMFSDQASLVTNAGTRAERTAYAEIVLNALRRFAEADPSKSVHVGRKGYAFFAKKQLENLTKVASIFFMEPLPLQGDSEQALNRGVGTRDNSVARFVKSAADIQLTPLAEDLIRHADSKTLGKSRIDHMRARIKSGAIDGAIR
jgi:hypothetical protein